MKRLLLLISCVSLYLNSFGQIGCTTPVSTTFFQRELGTISTTANSVSKLNYAINMVNTNCVSSQQVKQITAILPTDQDKLEFAKAAYKNTVDKENFYDVYDAFAFFSTVFRLHDYVLTQRSQNTFNNSYTTTTTTTVVNDFPAYIYPDYSSYFGVTGCTYPMDETTFNTNYTNFKLSKVLENTKATNIKDFINVNCLSTAQIMKLTSLLTMESYRLDVLKNAYLRAYDRGNFGYADQLLTTSTYKLDFNNYIKNNNTTTTTTTTTTTNTNNLCTVSSTDLNDIKNSINSSSFDNTKITVAKQALSAKKCFTVSQIKEILALYSFESSKLEVAKYAYDYCIDKSNYYQVNDVFSFSSSKDDLTKYIQGR